MRKIISIMGVVALSVGLLAGCSNGNSSEAKNNDGEKSEFEILSKRGEESVTLYKKKLNHKLR